MYRYTLGNNTFLRPGSNLATIPSGRLARKHLETRCVLLAKSTLGKETCRKLEQGDIYDN